jgi:hypothetical protein
MRHFCKISPIAKEKRQKRHRRKPKAIANNKKEGSD